IERRNICQGLPRRSGYWVPINLPRWNVLNSPACQNANDLGARSIQRNSQTLKHASRHAFALPNHAQEQVLGADVVMSHPPRFIDRQLDDLFRARSQPNLAHYGAVASSDYKLDSSPRLVQLDAHVSECLCRHSLALPNEPQEKMLSPDVVVVETQRLLLRQRKHPPRALGELIEAVRHGA